MSGANGVDWPTCSKAECIGKRINEGGRCLAHATSRRLRAELRRLGDEGFIHARGVTIRTELLDRLLAAAPRDEQQPHRPRFNEARFDHAIFGDRASFAHATFGDGASFAHASFGNRAWFADVIFEDRARFQGATLGNEAGFDRATFGDGASFADATFGDGAGFPRATFRDWPSFEGATFGVQG